MHLLGDMSKTLSRAAVYVSGRQARFELPALKGDFSFLAAQGVFGRGEATGLISSMQREAAQDYPDCRMSDAT